MDLHELRAATCDRIAHDNPPSSALDRTATPNGNGDAVSVSHATEHREKADAVDTTMPILVCYDGSEGAHRAIEFVAVAFPLRHVVVLSVWEPILVFGAYPLMNEADLWDATKKLAANGCARAAALGLDPTCAVAEAPQGVAAAIIEAAENQNAMLIVMGSRGHHGIHSDVLGSVVHSVAHASQRPLAIVPSPLPKQTHTSTSAQAKRDDTVTAGRR